MLSLIAASLFAVADVSYPPLPQAVSSLGAAVLDGQLYVYGGHAGDEQDFRRPDVLCNVARA